jgi:hypothetical protein
MGGVLAQQAHWALKGGGVADLGGKRKNIISTAQFRLLPSS